VGVDAQGAGGVAVQVCRGERVADLDGGGVGGEVEQGLGMVAFSDRGWVKPVRRSCRRRTLGGMGSSSW
jgi:hypothetical protein